MDKCEKNSASASHQKCFPQVRFQVPKHVLWYFMCCALSAKAPNPTLYTSSRTLPSSLSQSTSHSNRDANVMTHNHLSRSLSTLFSHYLSPIHSLSYQHCFRRILKPSGQLSGIGSCRLLLPTPQIIAEESTSLYGTSPVSISHRTTPNDLRERERGRERERERGRGTWVIHYWSH